MPPDVVVDRPILMHIDHRIDLLTTGIEDLLGGGRLEDIEHKRTLGFCAQRSDEIGLLGQQGRQRIRLEGLPALVIARKVFDPHVVHVARALLDPLFVESTKFGGTFFKRGFLGQKTAHNAVSRPPHSHTGTLYEDKGNHTDMGRTVPIRHRVTSETNLPFKKFFG